MIIETNSEKETWDLGFSLGEKPVQDRCIHWWEIWVSGRRYLPKVLPKDWG